MIPAFESSGLLPPFVSNDPTQPQNLSPYNSDTSELAARFCATPQRGKLLEGLLNYRQRLLSLGFVQGFQWLDGSFTEDIEAIEGRAPRDVDVVTFCYRPTSVPDQAAWMTFVSSNAAVFTPSEMKRQYCCDAYHVDLSVPAHWAVEQTRYFNGLFSHRRLSRVWKGMVRIELNTPNIDAQAAAQLGLT